MKKETIFILLFIFTSSQIIFSQETQNENQEQHQLLTDKFHFDLGLVLISKNVKLGADSSTPNEDIDFGNTFRLEDNEFAFFFNFDWSFSKKWNVSIETFSLSQTNSAILEKDIEWQDVVFNAGTNVKAGIDLDVIRVFFGRIFSRGFKHQFGAGLGVHVLNTSAFIEGNVFIDGVFEFERRRVSALIPLPNLGAWYYYTPSTKLALIARVDWFGIKIGDYSATLWDISPGIKYQVFKNVGLGLDYKYLLVKGNVDNSDWNGNLRMIFSGPLISINANF